MELPPEVGKLSNLKVLDLEGTNYKATHGCWKIDKFNLLENVNLWG